MRWRGALGSGVIVLGCAVGHGVGATPARAQAVEVRVAAESCPGVEALRTQLAPLLSESQVTTAGASPAHDARATAEVRDLGADYEVSIRGVQRRWSDPTRNCEERARVVAVFVALNVEAAAPPAAPPAEPAAPAPEPPPAHGPWALHAFAALAHAPDDRVTGFGGGLGGSWSLGGWRLALSAAAFAPVELALDATGTPAGSVRLTRVPFTLDVAYLWHAGRFAFGPQLGVVLDLLHLRGVDLEREQRELRLNPGLGAGLHLQLELGPVLLTTLRLAVEAFPRSYALVVAPAGTQGQTPSLWLRAELGLGVRLP